MSGSIEPELRSFEELHYWLRWGDVWVFRSDVSDV